MSIGIKNRRGLPVSERLILNSVFGYDSTQPINLHSHARWQIKPVVARCAHCGKQPKEHTAETDHKYQRNESLPRWLGWKPMRSGNATYLNNNFKGDGTKAASLMLRHSNTTVTTTHYIKQTKQQMRIREARKVLEMTKPRQMAASVLGAGLKQQAVN